MNSAMNKALQNNEVTMQLARIGAEVSGGSPANFGTFLSAEIKKWDGTVKDANIKLPN
jgi:tripartite-type tricarboxylate transporter receptor subunit TctC